MRTKQNLPYKGSMTEVGSVPMKEGWMGLSKPLVACGWPLHFLIPIELSGLSIEWTER